MVLVDVVDSGVGIPPDSLQSIFEPFITTKKMGLGMGLSLCQSIVSAHDGRIWAENNPEGGAMFHVALPAIEEPRSSEVEKNAIRTAETQRAQRV